MDNFLTLDLHARYLEPKSWLDVIFFPLMESWVTSPIFWGVGWGWNSEAMFGCEAWHGSHHGVGRGETMGRQKVTMA